MGFGLHLFDDDPEPEDDSYEPLRIPKIVNLDPPEEEDDPWFSIVDLD